MKPRAGNKRARITRSENMRRIRSKNTVPELVVRRLLRGQRIRFMQHSKKLPGKPDFVFPEIQKVLFVHGCFWHQHRGCNESHIPNSNRSYWQPKLLRNKLRDSSNKRKLTKKGWGYAVVWECQLKNEDRVLTRIERLVRE